MIPFLERRAGWRRDPRSELVVPRAGKSLVEGPNYIGRRYGFVSTADQTQGRSRLGGTRHTRAHEQSGGPRAEIRHARRSPVWAFSLSLSASPTSQWGEREMGWRRISSWAGASSSGGLLYVSTADSGQGRAGTGDGTRGFRHGSSTARCALIVSMAINIRASRSRHGREYLWVLGCRPRSHPSRRSVLDPEPDPVCLLRPWRFEVGDYDFFLRARHPVPFCHLAILPRCTLFGGCNSPLHRFSCRARFSFPIYA